MKTCMVEHCANDAGWHICRLHWFLLPLSLRQAWWKETDYGHKPPSPALSRQVRKEIALVES